MHPFQPIRFELIQSPVCGASLDTGIFPGGRGAIPAMPALVAKVDLGSESDTSMIDAYYCSAQLFDETGETRLSDELLFEQRTARASLIPSRDQPDELEILFIFGQVVIAATGTFRLRVILCDTASHTELASSMSGLIQVLHPDEFPGTFRDRIWTALSEHLRNNGILLHSPMEPDGLVWENGPNGI